MVKRLKFEDLLTLKKSKTPEPSTNQQVMNVLKEVDSILGHIDNVYMKALKIKSEGGKGMLNKFPNIKGKVSQLQEHPAKSSSRATPTKSGSASNLKSNPNSEEGDDPTSGNSKGSSSSDNKPEVDNLYEGLIELLEGLTKQFGEMTIEEFKKFVKENPEIIKKQLEKGLKKYM